ncbi:MAG: hypothetical protein K5929_02285 [Lachnospiraceae bacterium]|nr:hypothetical protein [Lachnospiraceae bacterium]
MDIWKVDETQVNVAGDGKKHTVSYYDAETGEMYRGSGICQMPASLVTGRRDLSFRKIFPSMPKRSAKRLSISRSI